MTLHAGSGYCARSSRTPRRSGSGHRRPRRRGSWLRLPGSDRGKSDSTCRCWLPFGILDADREPKRHTLPPIDRLTLRGRLRVLRRSTLVRLAEAGRLDTELLRLVNDVAGTLAALDAEASEAVPPVPGDRA